MKSSINTIFSNITRIHYFILLLFIVCAIFLFEQLDYYKKVEILNDQRVTVSKLYKLDEIDFDNQRAHLKTMIVKLNILEEYNFLNQNITKYHLKYENQIDKLNYLEDTLAKTIYKLIKLKDENISKKEKRKKKILYIESIEKQNKAILNHIATISNDLAQNNSFIFNILIKLIAITFFIFLASTIWYQQKLNLIYKDILFLMHLDSRSKVKNVFTSEVKTIVNKQKRRAIITDANTELLDPVTHINNNEGFLMEYTNKNLSKYKVLTLSIIEIDNSEQFRDTFSRAFTQAVLKKVAQTISLHVENRDIISRSSYNQFTVMLSKQSREEADETIENIRESIANLTLKTKITITGGTTKLETYLPLIDTITKAKTLLADAKNSGNNKILKG